MKSRFTKYLAIKVAEDSEHTMACSPITGRLFIPNGEPTLFKDEVEIKLAIKRSKDHLKKMNPSEARKTKYYVYKLNFNLLN
jgi:hypothetical protein